MLRHITVVYFLQKAAHETFFTQRTLPKSFDNNFVVSFAFLLGITEVDRPQIELCFVILRLPFKKHLIKSNLLFFLSKSEVPWGLRT